MDKVVIIYWTNSGNTEMMAEAIKTGAIVNHMSTTITDLHNFKPEYLENSTIIGLGCPAMGVEEIDQVYFAPFLNSIFDKIKNCKIFLFGSYSWGNGEWLKKWEVSCLQLGLDIIETFKCKETPNKAQESELINLAEEMFYKYGEK